MTERVTLIEMLACVERELKLREAVYPKRIEAGKMTQADATKELVRMRAVMRTLLGLQRLLVGLETPKNPEA